MNKYILGLAGILLILTIIMFSMWRSEVKENAVLQESLETAQTQIVKMTEYNTQKDAKIKTLQTKYNSVITNYVGTDCENQKVSTEMIEALRSLGENNE